MKRALAALLLAACARTDPGRQCSTLGECGAGHYCEAGYCRSDCATDADCARGTACTPNGQCVEQDRLFCAEGAQLAPQDVSAALPGPANMVLHQFLDLMKSCDLNAGQAAPPPGKSGGDPILAACGRLDVIYSLLHNAFFEMPGFAAECRPRLLSASDATWYTLPGLFMPLAERTGNGLDTSVHASWDAATVDFTAGFPDTQTLLPRPDRTWVHGTAARDGSGAHVFADANISVLALREAYADHPTAPIGCGSYTASATTTHLAGADTLDEELDSTDPLCASSHRLFVQHSAGRWLALLRDGDAHDPDLAFQVSDALEGRLDDVYDGVPRVRCWSMQPSNNGPTKLDTFSRDGQQVTGDAAACAFGAP